MLTAYCCPAPAKLNLFLHVIGRRRDGYHMLQSVFRFIDMADLLSFERRHDGKINRLQGNASIPKSSDLIVRAAYLLQQATGSQFGVDIHIDKKIPMGAGLGGGSSDAATTLIVLNRLWNTQLTRPQLMTLGLQLGADVPFFLFGRNAFAEGVGEALSPITLPENDYMVLFPGIHVPTAMIFNAQELTRDTKPVKMSDFLAAVATNTEFGRNDLQAVAVSRFPEIKGALAWLDNQYTGQDLKIGSARMTGSGACVFSAFKPGTLDTIAHLQAMPDKGAVSYVKGLASHPLLDWVVDV